MRQCVDAAAELTREAIVEGPVVFLLNLAVREGTGANLKKQ